MLFFPAEKLSEQWLCFISESLPFGFLLSANIKKQLKIDEGPFRAAIFWTSSNSLLEGLRRLWEVSSRVRANVSSFRQRTQEAISCSYTEAEPQFVFVNVILKKLFTFCCEIDSSSLRLPGEASLLMGSLFFTVVPRCLLSNSWPRLQQVPEVKMFRERQCNIPLWIPRTTSENTPSSSSSPSSPSSLSSSLVHFPPGTTAEKLALQWLIWQQALCCEIVNLELAFPPLASYCSNVWVIPMFVKKRKIKTEVEKTKNEGKCLAVWFQDDCLWSRSELLED